MDKTRDFILEGLSRYGLADFLGRPYDSAFEVIASPTPRKRLIMMGFNGSSADKKITNSESIIKDHAHPLISNIQRGVEGKWGIKRLAARLQQIPVNLGYNWQDVLYTNALMMCSANAAELKEIASSHNMTIEQLVKASMSYFEHVTIPLCKPEMIITYGNSLQSLSAAKILLQHFGDPSTLRYAQQTGYYTTFAFSAVLNDVKIPVICVRHMSRFKPSEKCIKTAIELMKEV